MTLYIRQKKQVETEQPSAIFKTLKYISTTIELAIASGRTGGLGLAICPKIMKLHGGSIRGENLLGEGVYSQLYFTENEAGSREV